MCDKIFHVALNHKTKAITKIALKLANKYFSRQNYFVSLILYNQLISHAKNKKDLSIGYANRSAVYFELKMYDECLQNIQWSRDNDYPENKWPQLNEREARCKKLMLEPKEVKINPWETFKLSYPPNKKVPWIAQCVEVKTTEKYGRGIYATRDLIPGDIICIEDIIINYRYTNYEYSHCYNCYKSNAMNLIPCNLTGHMMFCSTACRDELYCKAININGIVSVDVKILSDIVKIFGSVKNFDDFMLNTDPADLKKTIFDFDLSNSEDPDYQKNLMICLLSLSSINHPGFGECADIYHYLSEVAVKRILGVFNVNKKRSQVLVNKNEYLDVGCHVSLFASLVNHSCLNNAFTVLVDNKVATIIQHPVKTGEQIFFNYMSDADSVTTDNLKGLEELHKFKCDCKLCMGLKGSPDKSFRRKFTHAINLKKLDLLPFFDSTDYEEVKEYLTEKWKEYITVSIEEMSTFTELFYSLVMLDFIAGKSVYPF